MDISIDYSYGAKPKPKPLYRRLGRRAALLIGWSLSLLIIGLVLFASAMLGCAQLQCWTLW